MKLYLDTNVLIAILTREYDQYDDDTVELLSDCSNLLFTSPICVHEFIHLREIGKISLGREWKENVNIIELINACGIEILPLTTKHLQMEEQIPLSNRHNDPNDRLIIAQAISDKAVLVSSDQEFPKYCKYGLELHQTKRKKAKKGR